MLVLNTTSPAAMPSAPAALPLNVVPFSSASTASISEISSVKTLSITASRSSDTASFVCSPATILTFDVTRRCPLSCIRTECIPGDNSSMRSGVCPDRFAVHDHSTPFAAANPPAGFRELGRRRLPFCPTAGRCRRGRALGSTRLRGRARRGRSRQPESEPLISPPQRAAPRRDAPARLPSSSHPPARVPHRRHQLRRSPPTETDPATLGRRLRSLDAEGAIARLGATGISITGTGRAAGSSRMRSRAAWVTGVWAAGLATLGAVMAAGCAATRTGVSASAKSLARSNRAAGSSAIALAMAFFHAAGSSLTAERPVISRAIAPSA